MVRAHVLVCGGTGCTSSRSAEVLEELNLQIKEHGLEGEVQTCAYQQEDQNIVRQIAVDGLNNGE